MYASECALRVLIKGRGDDGRGDDSDGEVQRREGGDMAEIRLQSWQLGLSLAKTPRLGPSSSVFV